VTVFITSAPAVSAVPFLISEALASNIGGTATLIGDPPNIIVGSAAGLDFVSFLTNLAPIVILILIGYLLLAPRIFGNRLKSAPEVRERIMALDERGLITDPGLLRLSSVVLGLTLIGFVFHGFLGYEPATVALLGAVALLILSRQEPHVILGEIEWTTLLYFVGLFVVVGGLEWVGLLSDVGAWVADLTDGSVQATAMAVLWFSAILSGIVDNIPYTTAMVPVVRELNMSLGENSPGDALWWALALGACLGGNLTVIAASANVLAAGIAERGGQPIRFWEFFRDGAAVTFASVLVSSIYIWLRYLM